MEQVLTLSCLLSEPAECDGGVLTTSGDVRHELSRGDGLLFVSEQVATTSTALATKPICTLTALPPRAHRYMCTLPTVLAPPTRCVHCTLITYCAWSSAQRHNVSTVKAGVRRSFVLELWAGPTNARNRHS